MVCWCPLFWSYRRFIWRLWWQMLARLAIVHLVSSYKDGHNRFRQNVENVESVLPGQVWKWNRHCKMQKFFRIWMKTSHVYSVHQIAVSLSVFLCLSLFMMTVLRVMHYSEEVNEINKGLHTLGNGLHAEGNINAQWAQWPLRESFLKYCAVLKTLMANNLTALTVIEHFD